MDIKSRKHIEAQYSGLVDRYQKEPMRSLSITGNYRKEHQDFKFAHVQQILDKEDSLLDIGSGRGDLYRYCKKQGWIGHYTGLDLSKKMIEIAREDLGIDSIYEKDILVDNYQDCHDVVVSLATLQEKPSYEENPEKYLFSMIDKMFLLSNKAVIFDVFSNSFIDFTNKNNLYVSPSKLIEHCYTLTNSLMLINNYNPYQLMMVLYKKQTSGWCKGQK